MRNTTAEGAIATDAESTCLEVYTGREICRKLAMAFMGRVTATVYFHPLQFGVATKSSFYRHSYAPCAAVTPLVQQLRHLCSSYATCAAVMPLVQQLCPLCIICIAQCSSYTTHTAVTPLVQQLCHFTLIASFTVAVMSLLQQLRHF